MNVLITKFSCKFSQKRYFSQTKFSEADLVDIITFNKCPHIHKYWVKGDFLVGSNFSYYGNQLEMLCSKKCKSYTSIKLLSLM